MNKKIVGFVLAMCLTLGLGLSYLWAGVGDTVRSDGSYVSGENFEYTLKISKNLSTDSHTGSAKEGNVGNTPSKIEQVIFYLGGQAIAQANAQDKSVTVLDRGRVAVTFGIQTGGEWEDATDAYVITSVQIYGDEAYRYKDIGLKQYLINMGADNLVNCCPTEKDSDGNLTTKDGHSNKENKNVGKAETTVVGFLNVDAGVRGSDGEIMNPEEFLAGGINRSIKIGISNIGATCTFIENGKALYTVGGGSEATITEKYNYNSSGFLESVDKLTYTSESKTDPGADGKKTSTTKYKASMTTTYYDEYGRTSYVMTYSDLKKNNGYKSAEYEYSNNGSIVSVKETSQTWDKDAGKWKDTMVTTTVYINGKQAYQLNEKGSQTTAWKYGDNGELLEILSFYESSTSTKTVSNATSKQIFYYGKCIGVVDLSTPTAQGYSYEQALNDIFDFKRTGEINSGSRIKTVYLYDGDLKDKNSPLMNTLFSNTNEQDKDIYITNMWTMSNGYSAVGHIDISQSTATTTKNTTNVSKEEYEAAGNKTQDRNDGSKTRYVKTTKEKDIISLNLTVYNRGGQAYKVNETGRTCTTVEEYTKVDPIVIGTFKGTKKINGKNYAVVSASEVNIMDGTGFQTADGEEIYVELDESVIETVKGMKEGDEIMFMGNVTKDVNGHFTMIMDLTYSGGVAIGGDSIKAITEAIKRGELDWADENLKINEGILKNGGLRVDWKAGWDILTGTKKAEDLVYNENGVFTFSYNINANVNEKENLFFAYKKGEYKNYIDGKEVSFGYTDDKNFTNSNKTFKVGDVLTIHQYYDLRNEKGEYIDEKGNVVKHKVTKGDEISIVISEEMIAKSNEINGKDSNGNNEISLGDLLKVSKALNLKTKKDVSVSDFLNPDREGNFGYFGVKVESLSIDNKEYGNSTLSANDTITLKGETLKVSDYLDNNKNSISISGLYAKLVNNNIVNVSDLKTVKINEGYSINNVEIGYDDEGRVKYVANYVDNNVNNSNSGVTNVATVVDNKVTTNIDNFITGLKTDSARFNEFVTKNNIDVNSTEAYSGIRAKANSAPVRDEMIDKGELAISNNKLILTKEGFNKYLSDDQKEQFYKDIARRLANNELVF